MFEVVIIVLLGIAYILPYMGIVKLNSKEEEFLDSYTSFEIVTPMTESTADELIGSDTETINDVEDYPTLVDFSEENPIDIDITNMGR